MRLGKKEKNFNLSLWILLIVLAVCFGVLGTYAYFTATATESSPLQFGNLTLAFTDGTNELTDSTFSAMFTKVLPGDTIDFSKVYVKNKGNIDSYALIRLDINISGDNVSDYSKSQWYNLEGSTIDVSDLTINTIGATFVTAGGSHTTSFTYTFDGEEFDDSFKGANISLTLSVFAIQSNLPAHNVYTTTPLYATYLLVNEYGLPLEYFNISLPTVTGFDILDNNSEAISNTQILQGSNFTFKLNRATNYETARVIVKNNGVELKSTDTDTYTIYNVNDDINITIEPYAHVIDYTTLTTETITPADVYTYQTTIEGLDAYVVDYMYNIKVTNVPTSTAMYTGFDNVYNLNSLGFTIGNIYWSVASADVDNTYSWNYPLADNIPVSLSAGENLGSLVIREMYLTEADRNASIASAPTLQIGKSEFAVNTTKVDYGTFPKTTTEMSESVLMMSEGAVYYVYNYDIDNLGDATSVSVTYNTTFSQSVGIAVPGNWQVIDLLMEDADLMSAVASMVQLSAGTSGGAIPDANGKICILVMVTPSTDADIALLLDPDMSVTVDSIKPYVIDYSTLTSETYTEPNRILNHTDLGDGRFTACYSYDYKITNVQEDSYIVFEGWNFYVFDEFTYYEDLTTQSAPLVRETPILLRGGQDYTFSLVGVYGYGLFLPQSILTVTVSKCTSKPTSFMYEGLKYTEVDGGYEVSLFSDDWMDGMSSYTPDANLVIPSSLDDVAVVSIGASGAVNPTQGNGINTLTIPSNIKTFNWYSFGYCKSLTSINFAVTTGWQVSTDGGSTWSDTTTDAIYSALKQSGVTTYQWRRV